jgi:hypothetical protein
MGYLDAIGANTFQTNPRGQLVFAPWGRRRQAYLVQREEADAFVRFQRRYYLLMFITLPLSLIVFRSIPIMLGVGLVWMAGLFLKLWHFTRGLELAAEVPVVSREEVITRAATAMGSRTIATVGILSALMTAGSIWLLISGPRTIWAWVGVLYFAVITGLYAKRWWQLPHRGAAT